MEISKAKPASLLACVWVRLSDLNRPPRSLWFPPSSHWDDGQQIPAADQKSYRAEVQKAHEKFSETVRLTMLSLLSVGLFCLVALFSVSDSEFLVGNPKVKLPFVDTEISFQNFLVIGPLLLLVVTLYLHIFYGYWLDLESDCQHLSRKGEPLIERLPTLFSLDHPVPQVLSTFIFYWLAPLVLGTITWRAAVPYTWGRFPLALTTGIVSTILLFLQIQRCSAAQRQWNRPRWAVMIVIAACTAIIGFSPEWLEREWFQRSLNIA